MTKHQHREDDQLEAARELERAGDVAKAERAYVKLVTRTPTAYEAYNRLLVIYRKQKAYQKELGIVNKAIKAFENALLEGQKKWAAANKKAARLSRTLAKHLGIMNNKGLPVTDDPLLEKWKKRKALIKQKIAKA